MRTARFRTLVVALSLSLLLPGLALLPARPAVAAPEPTTTAASGSAGGPSVTDRLKGKGLLGIGGSAANNGQAALPHPATKPVGNKPLKPKRVKELAGRRAALDPVAVVRSASGSGVACWACWASWARSPA